MFGSNHILEFDTRLREPAAGAVDYYFDRGLLGYPVKRLRSGKSDCRSVLRVSCQRGHSRTAAAADARRTCLQVANPAPGTDTRADAKLMHACDTPRVAVRAPTTGHLRLLLPHVKATAGE